MEEIRRIQHDHRQHINVLRGLLENNQKNDILTYLDEYETSIQQNLNINGSDLAVILGNLWENAIIAALDADEQHSFIHLWIKTFNDKIMIKMENGYSSAIHFENDKFFSTKLNREHKEGIGINSIKSITESYGGITDFSFTDHVFTASIILYTTILE